MEDGSYEVGGLAAEPALAALRPRSGAVPTGVAVVAARQLPSAVHSGVPLLLWLGARQAPLGPLAPWRGTVVYGMVGLT